MWIREHLFALALLAGSAVAIPAALPAAPKTTASCNPAVSKLVSSVKPLSSVVVPFCSSFLHITTVTSTVKTTSTVSQTTTQTIATVTSTPPDVTVTADTVTTTITECSAIAKRAATAKTTTCATPSPLKNQASSVISAVCHCVGITTPTTTTTTTSTTTTVITVPVTQTNTGTPSTATVTPTSTVYAPCATPTNLITDSTFSSETGSGPWSATTYGHAGVSIDLSQGNAAITYAGSDPTADPEVQVFQRLQQVVPQGTSYTLTADVNVDISGSYGLCTIIIQSEQERIWEVDNVESSSQFSLDVDGVLGSRMVNFQFYTIGSGGGGPVVVTLDNAYFIATI